MKTIIVENLSKCYRKGGYNPYQSLRDAFSGILRKRREDGIIWALKDVSFEVEEGEVLGIIGPNGAGKTTLLKILSRITEPTSGRAIVRGRVGSLLEVGVGFHPELTGRENIYLNGAILGMKKSEIDRKFDEIVEFAELSEFIDTPIKYYSSGMRLRLAFSVAAFLDTDIVLVDEVLAVGDVAFQRKCLGQMDDVTKKGKTVLFVSHQMNQVRKLCKRALWLEGGEIKKVGYTEEVVSAYEKASIGIERVTTVRNFTGGKFFKWEIISPRGPKPNILIDDENVRIKFWVKIDKEIQRGVHGIALFDKEGKLLWAYGFYNLKLTRGVHSLTYHFKILPLTPGHYFWKVSLYDEDKIIDAWDCLPEMIVATKIISHRCDKWVGILNLKFDFECALENEKNLY